MHSNCLTLCWRLCYVHRTVQSVHRTVQSVTRHFKLVNLMTAVLLYLVDMRLLTSWQRYIWQPTLVLYAIQNEFKTRYLLHTRHKYLMLPFSCTFNLTAAVSVHCAAIKEQQTGCCLVYITLYWVSVLLCLLLESEELLNTAYFAHRNLNNSAQ